MSLSMVNQSADPKSEASTDSAETPETPASPPKAVGKFAAKKAIDPAQPSEGTKPAQAATHARSSQAMQSPKPLATANQERTPEARRQPHPPHSSKPLSQAGNASPADHDANAHPAPPHVEVKIEPAILPWDELGLSAELLNLVKAAGFDKPTAVQSQSIPRALQGQDLIVSAQTGTGKTAAFVFPIIEQVKGRQGTYALILAPTREIATQTQTVLEQFGAPFGIRTVALIGGTNIRVDEAALKNYPQVIVATPGRLCDHLDRGNIWLEFLETLVLDEADRMLEMGFSEQLNRVLQETPNTRQTLLFSATLSPTIEKLASRILYEPFRLQVGKESRAAQTVDQRFIFLDEDEKLRELEHLIYEERGTIFIFARSKDSAARLWRSLRNRGFHEATQLHSDLEQNVREQALQDFKDGRYRVLIATDVVGRGIHVDDVAHVINFDLPRDGEDYVHRIGRTGRAESSGKATSLVTPRDMLALKKIEKVLGRSITKQNSRR